MIPILWNTNSIHYYIFVDLFYITVRYLFLHKNQDKDTVEELEDEEKEKIEEIARDILKEMDVKSVGKISKEEFIK